MPYQAGRRGWPGARHARRLACVLSLLIGLLAGCGRADAPMRGSLEWDRIEIRVPVAERIERIAVVEGQTVDAGVLVAELDARVLSARLAAAEATLRQAEARLDELLAGPRGEQIRAARAREHRATSIAENLQRERVRVTAIVDQGLLPIAERDRAIAADEAAQAELAAVSAELAELIAGTRSEQIAQAQATVAVARADVTAAAVRRERMRIVTPRDGTIERLPFEVGDEPPAGAAVATLLVGVAPYARIYVPHARRLQIAPGAAIEISVHGQPQVLSGRVRAIASTPSFTPYFALSGDDADRLVYVAEVELGAVAAGLPAGIAVSARIDDRGVAGAGDD